MITYVNEFDMKKAFIDLNRDYYSIPGLATLLEYYDEIDENIEFDPIAICCECNEYGDGACFSWEDISEEYDYLLDRDEWMEESGCSRFDLDCYTWALLEILEEKTTVLRADNGNHIIFSF